MYGHWTKQQLLYTTDLLYIQVVPTRLIQAVRNKLLRVCSHQLVKNLLLRADDIRLVGTTCCESPLASSTLLQDYNNRLLVMFEVSGLHTSSPWNLQGKVIDTPV